MSCNCEPCSLCGLSIPCFPSCTCTQIPVRCSPSCRSPCCSCFCPCRPPTGCPCIPAPRCVLPPAFCRPSCVPSTPPPAIRGSCCRVIPSNNYCCQTCPCCPRY